MHSTYNIFIVLGNLLHTMLLMYMIIIIAGALISWVHPDPYNPIVQFLRKATEPFFSFLRKSLPLIIGGVDMSPIIALALIIFADTTVVSTIIEQGNMLANLLIGLGQSVYMITNFYMWIIIIAAVITFVNPSPYNPIVRFLYGITNPVFSWFRRRLPLTIGNIDLSPFVVILIIYLFNNIIVMKFIEIGRNIKFKGDFF